MSPVTASLHLNETKNHQAILAFWVKVSQLVIPYQVFRTGSDTV